MYDQTGQAHENGNVGEDECKNFFMENGYLGKLVKDVYLTRNNSFVADAILTLDDGSKKSVSIRTFKTINSTGTIGRKNIDNTYPDCVNILSEAEKLKQIAKLAEKNGRDKERKRLREDAMRLIEPNMENLFPYYLDNYIISHYWNKAHEVDLFYVLKKERKTITIPNFYDNLFIFLQKNRKQLGLRRSGKTYKLFYNGIYTGLRFKCGFQNWKKNYYGPSICIQIDTKNNINFYTNFKMGEVRYKDF